MIYLDNDFKIKALCGFFKNSKMLSIGAKNAPQSQQIVLLDKFNNIVIDSIYNSTFEEQDELKARGLINFKRILLNEEGETMKKSRSQLRAISYAYARKEKKRLDIILERFNLMNEFKAQSKYATVRGFLKNAQKLGKIDKNINV